MFRGIIDRLQATLGPGTAPRQLLTFLNVDLAGPVGAYLTAQTGQVLATATPAQAANIPIDAANSYNVIILTTNAVHTIDAPTNPIAGRLLTITIRNTSGGAAGAATFTGGAGGYRLAGAWVQAANNNQRSVSFRFDGTNWIEIARNAADVPV